MAEVRSKAPKKAARLPAQYQGLDKATLASILLSGRMSPGEKQKVAGSGSALSSAGTSVWDRLKSVGSTALDALSVPGAVTVTGLTNAIRAAEGKPLVSWKNLAGTFRDEKYAGGKALAETLGVSGKAAKLLGLGFDVAIDPLWFAGVGALKAGSRLGSASAKLSAAERLKHQQEAATLGAKAAELAPSMGLSKAEAAAKGVAYDPEAKATILGLGTRAAVKQAQVKAEGVVPALRVGFGKRTLESGLRVRRGYQVPLWHKAILKRNLAQVAPGKVRLSVLGEAVVRGSDRATSEAQAGIAQIAHDLRGVSDTALGHAGLLMATATHRPATLALIKDMKAAGMYTPEVKKTFGYLIRLGDRQAKELGLVPFKYQRNDMRRFLQGQQARLGEYSDKALQGHMARVRQIVLRQRDARLAQHAAQTDNLARAVQQQTKARAGQVSATSAALARIDGRIAAVKAQLAAKHNQPDFVAGLAARASKNRGVPGKTAARDAVKQRVAALNKELKALQAARADAQKAKKAAVGEYLKARKTAENVTAKVQQGADKIIAEHDDALAKVTERLQRSFEGSRASAEAQAVGEAHAFALQHKLTEFHPKTQRYALDKLGKLIPATSKKAKKLANPLDTMQALNEKVAALGGWNAYFKHAADEDMLKEVDEFMANAVKAGEHVPQIQGTMEHEASQTLKRRTASHPLEIVTSQDRQAAMVKAGIPEELAARYDAKLNDFFRAARKPTQYSKNTPGITWRPDLNALSVAKSRELTQYHTLLMHQVKDLVREVLPDKDAKRVWRDLTTRYRTNRIPGSPMTMFGLARYKNKEGRVVQTAIPRMVLATAWMKAWFTVMNPGHYVMNAVGSYINDVFEGNWRHAATGLGPSLPGHVARKLGRIEEHPVMDQTFKLGKSELTGRQLATYARLSGLGLGYTQAEIEAVAHIFQGEGRVRKVAQVMNKWNMDRENADRVWSWMNHIKKGDDPFTAAAKVIRTKFDYSAATEFERIWARNLMLFYTWYKNNLVLQGYGLMAKPGVYSTLNHIENARPKDPAEPSWWHKAGGLYSPWGLITFGNPMADIYKYEVSQQNLRQNLLGALNPVLSTPISLLTNKDLFTGGELSKFSDQNTPSPLGYVLNPVGIGTPSRGQAEGERTPAVPWWLAKIAKDFTGPYGTSLSAVTSRPDSNVSPWYNVAPRVTGVRVNPVDREQWERSLKARLIKKRADATRKANYERP